MADFYAARDNTMSPLLWPSIAPPITAIIAQPPEPSPISRAAFETMQFFEVEIPEGQTSQSYMETQEFREECADLILSGFIEFQLEREFDVEGTELCPLYRNRNCRRSGKPL